MEMDRSMDRVMVFVTVALLFVAGGASWLAAWLMQDEANTFQALFIIAWCYSTVSVLTSALMRMLWGQASDDTMKFALGLLAIEGVIALWIAASIVDAFTGAQALTGVIAWLGVFIVYIVCNAIVWAILDAKLQRYERQQEQESNRMTGFPRAV